MKILFVRTYCPSSILYGSEMRSSRFVDYLNTKGEVDLLTLTTPQDGRANLDYIKSHFKDHYYFDQNKKHQKLNILEKLFRLLPCQLTEHYAKDIQHEINQIVEKNQYDLIFVYKLEPLFYFLQLPKKWHQKIVMDFDDIMSDLYLNFYQNKFTAYKNSYSLKLYEHKALSQFKHILVCSQDAVTKIIAPFRHKTGIVPNVFPTNRQNFYSPTNNPKNLLFVGSLDYFANTDGLKWFFQTIWPEFRKTYPDVKLSLVGKTPRDKERISSLIGAPGDIEFNLNVASVMPYYKDCFASIVPLLNGSGTRLKILESAAYGRPVLTTLKGMEGLDFVDKKNIFIFNNASTFINAYKDLLNQERYGSTTEGAWQTLQERYSPETFLTSMNKSWESIIKPKI